MTNQQETSFMFVTNAELQHQTEQRQELEISNLQIGIQALQNLAVELSTENAGLAQANQDLESAVRGFAEEKQQLEREIRVILGNYQKLSDNYREALADLAATPEWLRKFFRWYKCF